MAIKTRQHRLTGFLIWRPHGDLNPVIAVKGRCPRPLDDGDFKTQRLFIKTAFTHCQQSQRSLLTMQSPVVEVSRIELLTSCMPCKALSQLSYTPQAS